MQIINILLAMVLKITWIEHLSIPTFYLSRDYRFALSWDYIDFLLSFCVNHS